MGENLASAELLVWIVRDLNLWFDYQLWQSMHHSAHLVNALTG